LQVEGIAGALAQRGVVPGDRVGVLAQTSHTWAAVDLAILSLGAITVGLSTDLPPEELARRLKLVAPRLVLADSPATLPNIQVVPLPGRGQDDLQVGHNTTLDDLERRLDRLTPDLPATIAFTAGTTGPARGAVLTHSALQHAVLAGRGAFGSRHRDRSVVALPMDHIHQRYATYAGTDQGIVGWYPRDLSHLPETIRAARPQLLVVSPAVLEDIRLAARTRAVERGFGGLYDWACQPRSGRTGWRARAEREIANRMVYRRIRRGLGGQLRTIVSGGGRLSPALARWFGQVGIRVVNGWGLAETGAPLTASREIDGTVGHPLPGVAVRTSAIGELEVSGPCVMTGYYGNPKQTKQTLSDGWLRTGDVGEVDELGRVVLQGRLQDQVPGPTPLDLGEVDAGLSVPGRRVVVSCIAHNNVGINIFSFRPRGDATIPDTTLRSDVAAWNDIHPVEHRIVGHATIDACLSPSEGTCTPTLSPRRDHVMGRYMSLLTKP